MTQEWSKLGVTSFLTKMYDGTYRRKYYIGHITYKVPLVHHYGMQ